MLFLKYDYFAKKNSNFLHSNELKGNFSTFHSQFLTINNADERAHLVPVLNIILKLSPNESKTLQSVARGVEGGQSSWSNLLPSW